MGLHRGEVDARSQFKRFWTPNYQVILPPEDIDAVCVAQAIDSGNITLNGASVKGTRTVSGAAKGAMLAIPGYLVFTLAASRTFTCTITGRDHLGISRTLTFNKAGAQTTFATGLFASSTALANIVWSYIDDIVFTNIVGGTTNVEVGFAYNTTPSSLLPRLPLPRTGLSTAAQLVVQFMDQGGGTIVPAPPSVLTNGTPTIDGSVVTATITTYTAPPTLPMRFAVGIAKEAFDSQI